MEFVGEPNEEIADVQSINECRNLCLASSVYQCRSATYDSNAKVCRLTEETRRSAPSDFRIAERGVDYIENECADGKNFLNRHRFYADFDSFNAKKKKSGSDFFVMRRCLKPFDAQNPILRF